MNPACSLSKARGRSTPSVVHAAQPQGAFTRCPVLLITLTLVGMHDPPKRVVSLLPSATEILCLIGGEHLLVGRSHECDFPASIRPVLTRAINTFRSSQQMHDAVTDAMSTGKVRCNACQGECCHDTQGWPLQHTCACSQRPPRRFQHDASTCGLQQWQEMHTARARSAALQVVNRACHR